MLKSLLAGDIGQVVMLNRYKCLTWLTETGEVKAGEKFVYQKVLKVCECKTRVGARSI